MGRIRVATVPMCLFGAAHCARQPPFVNRSRSRNSGESCSKMKHDTFLAVVLITLICSSRRKCFSPTIVQSLVVGVGSAKSAAFVVAERCFSSLF